MAIGVWVNFGSRDEKKDENGITHLIEHMVFKGTANFTAENIVETVESRGGYHQCVYDERIFLLLCKSF